MKTKLNNEKSKGTIYLIWVLIISNLFFEELFGLNALIITGITIPLLAYFQKAKLNSSKWWMGSALWIISAIGVFIHPTVISVAAYFISFLFFTAVTNQIKLSFPIGLSQSLFAFSNGFILLIESMQNRNKDDASNQKRLLKVLVFTIPVVVLLIFLKLYQLADPKFAELTAFINLNWISWKFIVFYLVLFVALYGFYYFQNATEIEEFEERLPNEVNPSYTDRLQKFFGLSNERNIAIILLLTLNILLLSYNAIDIYNISNLSNGLYAYEYSQNLHDGVNALIASLVLVILILSHLFRGKLNFLNSPLLKGLALLWLVQNCIMIATTSIKNYSYIAELGLTYKRIGVYVYLILALIGLILTIVKITRKKSFWFLVRTTSLAFTFFLTSLLTFNWNRFIAAYNINNVSEETLDIDYLMTLGPDTYSHILDYHQKTGNVDNGTLREIQFNMDWEQKQLNIKHYEKTWRSMNWTDMQLQRDLKAYTIQLN